VRDNLTFFDSSVPDEQVGQALEELGLRDWYAAMPRGLDTELGPGGSGLSAGEAQLLAFTRIFLKDPGLVILDEPSSRMDPATERRVKEAIVRLVRGRTAILIAHRLSTLELVDEILLIDHGRIVEHGLRAELAADPASRFHQLLVLGSGEGPA
jgi:ABC-type multidrug transport system fused ATPase/permease subunit